jgi:hypothetical protein
VCAKPVLSHPLPLQTKRSSIMVQGIELLLVDSSSGVVAASCP